MPRFLTVKEMSALISEVPEETKIYVIADDKLAADWSVILTDGAIIAYGEDPAEVERLTVEEMERSRNVMELPRG